ncbi:MAG: acylphosphatase [Proteobacteria bacterium]|nr:acylphosphatase [Pseudomonadota bacterium]
MAGGAEAGGSAVVRRRALASGSVQGVFFRESTRRCALDLGVRGWVRNLPDGRVEAVFEGPEARVAEALDFVRRGPPLARVVSVEVSEEAPRGSERFEVR